MDGIAWAVSAMSAAQTRLDVAAANLANAATEGFRRSTLRGSLTASGVRLQQVLDGAQGPLRQTGRPFDLAIAGRGTFRVRGPNGKTFSTRCGSFTRDRNGHLVDRAGRSLLGTSGPIVVPSGGGIEASGEVTGSGLKPNRIALPEGSTLRSGFAESSNVDSISEMIDILSAQRSFESAQKVVSAIDQTRERGATQVATVHS
ncbi:MAG TPA: flagellar hook-basal body complex protein [Candidatus Baltobacteraceae bacterium]|jgi:flagellar basal-body rod protein FlgG|nr:flagellar hook-basal body complex protein [Candidatus Baltobacteraceae bacterium]